MPVLIPAVSAFLLVIGLFVVAQGFLGVPEQDGAGIDSQRHWQRIKRRWLAVGRKIRLRLLVGFGLGVLATLFSGFLPALVILPAFALVIPEFLVVASQPELELLAALDRWLTGISAANATGKSVLDAIRTTSKQCPELLREPLRRLLIRLDDRYPLRRAMQLFADEIDSADADAVVAALILIIERGGAGAGLTLQALTQQIRDRLRALREIAAEREKPRMVVRQVTVITVVVLAAAIALAPDYFAAMLSPLGQLIAIGLATAYLAALLVLRKMAQPRVRERILLASDRQVSANG